MKGKIYYFDDLKNKTNNQSSVLLPVSDSDNVLSNIKRYAFDCSFSLARVYYKEYENYLMNILFACLNYFKTKEITYETLEGNNITLSNYSLYELCEAIINKYSKTLNSYLDENNINEVKLIQSISSLSLEEEMVVEVPRRSRIL
ncbi:MAG: hypothetical protein IJ572_01300 [Bacilli bacterium]|nr:hypothetical protein [Bacilli bacterium]